MESASSSVVERSIAARIVTGSNPVWRFSLLIIYVLPALVPSRKNSVLVGNQIIQERCIMTSSLPIRRVFFSRSVPYAVDHFRKLIAASSNEVAKSIQIAYYPSDNHMPRAQLLQQVKGITGLLCALQDTIDQELIAAAGPYLKVVSTLSVGYDHIDIQACNAAGIVVGNTPGVLDVTTAETAVALTFTVKRKLLECVNSARTGSWGAWHLFRYCGSDSTGNKIGIVGLGRIGTEFAKMMHNGFNCNILYTGPNRKPENEVRVGSNIEYVDLDTLLVNSDVVSLHLPLTTSTHKFFDSNCFDKMKSDAVFINTTRGDIIDQDALYVALSRGKIAGAGLDVTTPEPLPPTHPLFSLPNCTIFPHIGSATVKTRQSMADIAVQNLFNGVIGVPLAHQV
ncbi:unnamed protein product [Albugo candida]|uniref:Glyoxylate reductase/hydroxypyruvate reductase n=1 Tax=Albugo candida TaxID=65357 RepID=A0A024FUT7_9STRA|nr:unnamed protein product [Albugo candida]|eukprot:CCI10806.1 unnamed protein product [Albugo candida]